MIIQKQFSNGASSSQGLFEGGSKSGSQKSKVDAGSQKSKVDDSSELFDRFMVEISQLTKDVEGLNLDKD